MHGMVTMVTEADQKKSLDPGQQRCPRETRHNADFATSWDPSNERSFFCLRIVFDHLLLVCGSVFQLRMKGLDD